MRHDMTPNFSYEAASARCQFESLVMKSQLLSSSAANNAAAVLPLCCRATVTA